MRNRIESALKVYENGVDFPAFVPEFLLDYGLQNEYVIRGPFSLYKSRLFFRDAVLGSCPFVKSNLQNLCKHLGTGIYQCYPTVVVWV